MNITAELLGDNDAHWMSEARCVDTWFAQPDDFFPRKGDKAAAERAKRICNGDPKADIAPCPVRLECLAYALAYEGDATSHRFGVYGGTSANERHILARRNRRNTPAA